ncbi:aromatase/bifunctional cyclase/aromatase [Amycolatopsis xylanica]|uniref:Aromatase/bifunctional cyclase/aromatase n=1 Tax=Amycolatopsis xylanica TaxID=589385 RepID=A0A1H2VSS8_9PSEU|nr:aromatase/cyclase [Amycolatopsis xylanica]SDW71395.1 aromatase/bifunctional cyclase/aromatase [Amycolatopsis xylanica]
MAETELQHTRHEISIDAPAETVYRVIADATAWPQHLAPTIHVERTGLPAGEERLRIWADANGEVKNWTSRRVLHPHEHRIEFRQEVSTAPVASMAGEWTVRPVSGGCVLALTHEFTAVDAAGLDWVASATDRNSHKELANIKALAENWDHAGELLFSFEDSVTMDCRAEDVYAFLDRADRWPALLPHVARLDLREDVEHIQRMTMDTTAKDGSVHTTESVRVCFPDAHRIVYKQLVPPSLMAVHTGEWTVRELGGGRVLVTSRHVVAVNEAAVERVLGAGRTVADARKFITEAAGGNSLATLTLAKRHLEAATDKV